MKGTPARYLLSPPPPPTLPHCPTRLCSTGGVGACLTTSHAAVTRDVPSMNFKLNSDSRTTLLQRGHTLTLSLQTRCQTVSHMYTRVLAQAARGRASQLVTAPRCVCASASHAGDDAMQDPLRQRGYALTSRLQTRCQIVMCISTHVLAQAARGRASQLVTAPRCLPRMLVLTPCRTR